jgi:hypothetical protein
MQPPPQLQLINSFLLTKKIPKLLETGLTEMVIREPMEYPMFSMKQDGDLNGSTECTPVVRRCINKLPMIAITRCSACPQKIQSIMAKDYTDLFIV